MLQSRLCKVDFVKTVFFAGDFIGKMKIFKKKVGFHEIWENESSGYIPFDFYWVSITHFRIKIGNMCLFD